MDPLLLSVEEAAQALGIGRSKTYELIASGQVPSLRIGRRTLVPARALSEAVDRMVLATRAGYTAPESLDGPANVAEVSGPANRRTAAGAQKGPRRAEVA